MSTNPDDLGFFGEGEPDPNEEFRKLRDHTKNLEKQVKQGEKERAELADLRSFKETYEREQKAAGVKEAFAQANLPPSLGGLYVLANPEATEVTAEAARSFAAEYGIPVPEGEAPPPPVPAPAPTADRTVAGSVQIGSQVFYPAIPGITGGEAPSPKPMTPAEWKTLHDQNPAAAKQAYLAGKVAFSPEAMASARPPLGTEG